MADLAGAPQEIIDPCTGEVLGCAVHTLYGQRRWRGTHSTPLLFAGQYVDQESGWAYNRFRFYDPKAGIYNAQDPLGVAARLSSAQGYVAHPVLWCDPFGLKQYSQVDNPALQARIDALSSNQKGQVGEKIAREMFEGGSEPRKVDTEF
ncbi:RHS repeat domain-containing protein [Corynebacterium mayonis]|uniref:RHS repeat domain-containing protein n=1 Tax=Corynebacterium mayonis TaxID=3062461 RepID=UPI00314047A3